MNDHINVIRGAIIFGTPVTWAEFEQAAQHSDYISGMLHGRSPAQAWDEDYAHVAGSAQQLIHTARTLGVEIYQHATVGDLARATRQNEYVVVFAHWRGAMFRRADFVSDLETLSARLSAHPLLRKITCNGNNLDAVVDALNAEVESGRLLTTLPFPIAEAGKRSRSLGQTLCRDLLDEALLGLIQPGNRLELFDGLHSPDEVDDCIWSGFCGELDLGLCNSSALATFIDLRRGARIRHLHWPEYLLPGPQYLKVELTLKIMAVNGDGYIASRLMVEEQEAA